MLEIFLSVSLVPFKALPFCEMFRNINNGVVQFQPLYYNISIFRSIKLYSTVAESFPNFLVESLGFSEDQSLSLSSKLFLFRGPKVANKFGFAENAYSVINLFKDYGFNQSQIKGLVSSDPRIFTANVEKTLIPKLNFLQNEGFSGDVLSQIVCADPIILRVGLEYQILPAIRCLKEILGCDSDVISVLVKGKWIGFSSVSKNLVKNIDLLQSYEIPIKAIRKRLIMNTSTLLRNHINFEDIVIKVEQKLGIPRSSGLFLTGVHLLCGLIEKNLDSKMELFKSFGWLESDLSLLCRTSPMCLGLSKTMIEKKLGFLVDEMGLKPAYIASNSKLLSCNLENRVMARLKILAILKEKGLTKPTYSPGRVVSLTETQFLSNFVLPFKEVRQVYTQLTGFVVVKPDDVA